MNLLSDVISINSLSNDTEQIVNDVITSKQPKVVMLENEPAAVLFSFTEYKRQMTRFLILEKLQRAQADANDGRVSSHADVVNELRQRFPSVETE